MINSVARHTGRYTADRTTGAVSRWGGWARLLTGGIVAVVIWHWGQALTIQAKAVLAQYLIRQAWHESQSTSASEASSHKPWGWADTWPVARLQWLPAGGNGDAAEDLMVLSGTNGSSLAFGPGHMDGTALPGEGGSVIAGHRDTHFAFLRHVVAGDRMRVQGRDGDWKLYRIDDTRVVDTRTTALNIAPDDDILWLITCYPFHTVTVGGPLRYQVRATRL